MSFIRLLLVLLILVICSLHETEARPRAHIVGNHIRKRQRNSEREISNNKTGKKWRQSKQHLNRNLIKSLLAFEEDYEYDSEEYDAPIIEIRFRRSATGEDKIETESFKEDVLHQNVLRSLNY